MKLAQSILASAIIAAATVTSPAWAAKDQQGEVHHPAGAVVAQGTVPSTGQPMPGRPAGSGQPMPGMVGMEDQMKAMQEMHQKMMATKTPEERNALMAEHGKVMQEGMTMMNRMGGSGMSGTQSEMAARQGQMEQRMDMMQSMMQMMMDRMAPAPTAK